MFQKGVLEMFAKRLNPRSRGGGAGSHEQQMSLTWEGKGTRRMSLLFQPLRRQIMHTSYQLAPFFLAVRDPGGTRALFCDRPS